MTNEKEMILNSLPKFLRDAIEHRIKKEAKKIIERAKKEIEEKEAELVAGVILDVQRIMEIERYGETLKINIKLTKDK